MKGSITTALAVGTLAVIAFGGMAMASELEDPGVTPVAVEATDAPDVSDEESSDDVSSSDTGEDAEDETTGLSCVLVPIEVDEVVVVPTEGDTTEGDEVVVGDGSEDPAATPSIDELLAANDIECTGTGNERSAEVALVPRYLAHSDDYTGAEKGLAISSWAKTHSNQKSDDESEPVAPEDGDAPEGDVDSESTAPSSPGRSGDAHGQSESHGQGRGR